MLNSSKSAAVLRRWQFGQDQDAAQEAQTTRSNNVIGNREKQPLLITYILCIAIFMATAIILVTLRLTPLNPLPK